MQMEFTLAQPPRIFGNVVSGATEFVKITDHTIKRLRLPDMP